MDKETFQESLLQIMEGKVHWAWPAFTSGMVPIGKLHHHLESEYEVYVRDFPVLIARAYIQSPIPEVRQELIENIYEEETGGIAAGKPHPELFLEYPRHLGMDMKRFHDIALGPKAEAFRDCLDSATTDRGWQIGAAVTTLFLEGTPHERGELDASYPQRPCPPLEEHPLVKHYGLPLEALALTKAHRNIEGEHRKAAWKVILEYVEPEHRESVVQAMKDTLAAWRDYRDEIAALCLIGRHKDGTLYLLDETD